MSDERKADLRATVKREEGSVRDMLRPKSLTGSKQLVALAVSLQLGFTKHSYISAANSLLLAKASSNKF